MISLLELFKMLILRSLPIALLIKLEVPLNQLEFWSLFKRILLLGVQRYQRQVRKQAILQSIHSHLNPRTQFLRMVKSSLQFLLKSSLNMEIQPHYALSKSLEQQ